MKKEMRNRSRNGKTLVKTILITLLFLFNFVTPRAVGDGQNNLEKEDKYKMFVNDIRKNIQMKLINEVDRYIKSISPDSGLSPEFLVEKCFEHNFDIPFVMAQALLESHFGTKGIARRTKSVWNVGTYDNGQILYEYDNPNLSLEPYIKLVKENYLVTTTPEGEIVYKDFSQLLEDNGYVNHKGKRFASSTDYESKLRKIVNSINKKSTIRYYQNILSQTDGNLLAFYRSEPNEIGAELMS